MSQLPQGLKWTTVLAITLTFVAHVLVSADARHPAASQAPVEKIAYYSCYYFQTDTWQLACFGTVANVDGTGAVSLAYPWDAIDPAWSPDGSRIAFSDRYFGLSV